MEVIKNSLGTTSKKPLVISSSKYMKIISTINGENIAKEETDREKLLNEYLKLGSEEMVVKWSGSFKRAQEQPGRKGKFADKALKEKPEQTHREMIAKAGEHLQKAKPVPKDLQSAANQNTARLVQRNFDHKLEKTSTKITAEEQPQTMPCRRFSNQTDRNNQYKAELLSDFNEKFRMMAEHSIIDMAVNKRAHEKCIRMIRAEMERQQDLLRRKALETMILVEQSKARKLNTIFGKGKPKIDRNIEARQDRGTCNAINTPKLIALQPNTRKAEEERLRKNIRAIQLQFSAQEKKVQCSRQEEFTKMQDYRKLHTQKDCQMKEPLLALPNRLRNDEANETRLKNYVNLGKVLTEQIQQHKQMEVKEKAYDFKPTTVSFEKEDAFLNYINKLVPNAIRNERPLYRFVQPSHLESHLRIGVKTPLPRDELPTVRKYQMEELKKLNPYESRRYE